MLALCLAWLTVAWADATLGAALSEQRADHRVVAVATVSATHDRQSTDLSESERLELLTTQQRGFGRDQTGVFPCVAGPHEVRPSGTACRAPHDRRERGRLSQTALVGHFANPPPVRQLA